MLVEALTNLKTAGVFRKKGDKFMLPDELVAKDELIEKGKVKRVGKPPAKPGPSAPWKKPGKKKTGGSGQASYPG